MRAIALLFFLAFSSSLAVADEQVESPTSRYIEPCQFWSYSSEVSGYVCRNTSFSFQVMEAYEVERYINDLQRQIDDLERRVMALESSK